ncbi:hypothetical protein AALO_G00031950 [Alosa alosa]|uniref:PWWP domain-containing protein n=1 Tax=Alosa alosa TaxID=278164 RepID=A0AAV6HCS9_9TELE|nr:PWWP domain-containing protein 2A [Alosa alosa]XP_048093133.1 PWWP domain-containing protein 2A [Alosa alosa]KAG5284920.1 hypothetical protein AALO_G00031950 [Alosa alosa]
MAAVAAEPGAAAASTTAGEEVEFESESAGHEGKLNSDVTRGSEPVMDLCHQHRDVDAVQECSQFQMEIVRRPDIEAAGKTLSVQGDDEHGKIGCLSSEGDNTVDDYFVDYKLKDNVMTECLKEQCSPILESANEVNPHDSHACLLPSSISVSQPSVVFLHSLPAHPSVTETGLSLAEPAEPAIVGLNLESIDHFRELIKPSSEPDPVPESACDAPGSEFMAPEDALHECPQHVDHPQSLSVSESESNIGGISVDETFTSDFSAVPPEHSPQLHVVGDTVLSSPVPVDSCSPQQRFETGLCEVKSEPKTSLPIAETTGSPLDTVEHLIPGSEVRVSLDHIIDDALVVSFRLGEKIFSGVLMDLSKRFGPYGIPITLHPKREYKDKPESMQLKAVPSQPETEKGGSQDAADAPRKDPEEGCKDPEEGRKVPEATPEPWTTPWTSKPPPLFQEGAPYPPPLFIRDTYNQSLPQPLPRKIKRPKRRLYREEPTSIMNAIKLRPRQVLCDKCKGAVATGDRRETRRGPASDCRADDAKRRRGDNAAASAAGKRPRNDHRPEEKVRGSDGPKRQAPGIRISASSSSLGSVKGGAGANKVVNRGVSSTAGNSSRAVHLNTKKVLQSKNIDHAKAQEVLKIAKAQRQRDRETASGGSGNTKAMTRAAALQEAHQKVHFTRRLQQISGGGGRGISTPLPPRMRIKPQRYRNEENDSSPCKPPCLEKVPGSGHVLLPKPGPPRCPSTRSSCSSSSSSSTGEAVPAAVAAATAESLGPAKATDPEPRPLGPSQCQPPVLPLLESEPEPETATESGDSKVEPDESEGREERRETRGSKAGNLVVYVSLNPNQPDSSSTSMCSVDSADEIKSSNSECSSTETFDFPPPGALPSAAPAPGTSSAVTTAAATTSSAPKDEKRRGKSIKGTVYSKNVSKCVALDGRTICVGDIVWAKIYGFPWWPARILAIQVSRKDNGLLVRQEARVAWFGSPTTSYLGLSQLAPFLESFQSRFDKKRKGLYRKAITEAAKAAKQLTPEVRALLTQFET